MACILWVASSSVIKTFGLLIIFILVTNAIGYVLFDSGQGSGLIIMLDCLIYIVAAFLIAKMNGGNLLDLTRDSSTVNIFLKIISLCVLYGFVHGLVEKYAYEEHDSDIKTYLLEAGLRSYAINATIFLGIYIYLMQSSVNVFTGLFSI